MSADLLLAIDQGTSSTRAIAFDLRLRPVAAASCSVVTTHPHPGWAQQDPEALVDSVVETVARVLRAVGGRSRIAAVGLDNQGETVVAWDAATGNAISPAILWHCRRSAKVVERLIASGIGPAVRARTGLPLDPYFSASKLTWIIEEMPAVRKAAERGTLRVGTVDAWLTERLGGHARTDPSTASRTQLLDLTSATWDEDLLDRFGVSRSWLPRIVDSAGDLLGRITHPAWGGDLPLRALLCDQQAALAGHGAFDQGDVKATFGTGAFVVANAGEMVPTTDTLETSIGWRVASKPPVYALQGGVLTAGAFLDWLGVALGVALGVPARVDELDALARSVDDAGGVMVIPALAGLAAPWWRPDLRATVAGIHTGTSRAHVVRAAIDGLAHLVADILEVIDTAVGRAASTLRVDGGASASATLMQRVADLTMRQVEVAAIEGSTALGIAGMAGIGAGLLKPEDLADANTLLRRVEPSLAVAAATAERERWRRFVASASELAL